MAEAMIYQKAANPVATAEAPPKITNTDENSVNERDEETSTSSDIIPSCLKSHKRQRTSPPVSNARKIIDDITHSVSHEKRLSAIVAACSEFDHNILSAHDEEIEAGADAALCKHLAFLLLKQQQLQQLAYTQQHDICSNNGERGSNEDDKSLSDVESEIGYTCTALEMVFRCSSSKLAESFHLVGSTELLPLLLTVMGNCVQKSNITASKEMFMTTSATSSLAMGGSEMCVQEAKREQSKNDNAAKVTIMKSTKVLGHFATIPQALVPMAFHRGLVSMLRRVAKSRVADKARYNALWTLANLACDPDNMIMMACHSSGLLDSLVEIAYQDKSQEARSHAAKAIMNLAWRPENKIPMSERPKLLSAMVELMGSKILKTRQHAARALRFLSEAPAKTKVEQCLYENGKLLSTLVRSASSDIDRTVRESSMAAIQNLACEETVKIIGEQSEVMDLLLKQAISTTERGNAPIMAGNTLCVLAEHIKAEMGRCHTDLQKCIKIIASWSESMSESPTYWSPRREKILRHLCGLKSQ